MFLSRKYLIAAALTLSLLGGVATAQHDHKGHKQARKPKPAVKQPHPAPQAPSQKPEARAQEHEHPSMDSEHRAHETGAEMMTTVTGGPFKSMHAIGSGTSLLPASMRGYMWHWMKGNWMLMLHGDVKVGFNHQGGPRGVGKAESQNWVMLMGEREAGSGGRLMLRGMFSAEPWTTPNGGFPQLFQTGETHNGRPIVDAQHPHDLFMELAAGYTVALSESVALHFYGGPVGEPALGPPAFMHRPSASEAPAAPLGHHLQDSTHIAHGVLTSGVTAWRLRLEGSLFRGEEPDEERKDIELGKLDSWSLRAWFTPTENWSAQFSHGHLNEPEAIDPGDTDRTTASIAYNRPWQDGNWASSLIWGRNHEEHGNFNSYLLESTVNFLDRNYLYTRLELVDKSDLLGENIFGRRGLQRSEKDRLEGNFRIGAFTFGGVRDFVTHSKVRVGVGADVTFYRVPGGLEPVYGSSPTSFRVFLRVKPGRSTEPRP